MSVKKVEIVGSLFERLKTGEGDFSRTLLCGLPMGYGGLSHPIAVTIVRFQNNESVVEALRVLPFGLSIIGVVEFETDEEQDVYAAVDSVENPVLLKVVEGKISAFCGLDFLTTVHLNVVNSSTFWDKTVTTFRVQGQILITSLLEVPELQDCFALAKTRVLNQVAYTLGRNSSLTILPRLGNLVSENDNIIIDCDSKTSDMVKIIQNEETEKNKDSSEMYFRPAMSITDVKILHDQSKAHVFNNATIVIADKTPNCKYFEHFVDVDVLVIVPSVMPVAWLYHKFNSAVCSQLEDGFKDNIIRQLNNSITAVKPETFHFWPSFLQHPVTVVYPQQVPDEKLEERRQIIHRVLFARLARPFFRRPASLFQPTVGLISPHVSLRGKFSETVIIDGHYEYRHYMQESFNDDGWGCAYRSLQTIVSWFRLQGYTNAKVPTHREIQECLVSLNDKPQSFIGSRQWIGSTEVGFVLEALLGISCRIISLSSGAEMKSRISELQSHFKIHGTPIMVGGGVLAHTLIGASRDPDMDEKSNLLVLDPHFTGKDDINVILNKGWVGWKDNNFWSTKDFYNLCLPLLPTAI